MSAATTASAAGGVQLVDTPGRPARDDQRARIRAAFHQPEARRPAA